MSQSACKNGRACARKRQTLPEESKYTSEDSKQLRVEWCVHRLQRKLALPCKTKVQKEFYYTTFGKLVEPNLTAGTEPQTKTSFSIRTRSAPQGTSTHMEIKGGMKGHWETTGDKRCRDPAETPHEVGRSPATGPRPTSLYQPMKGKK